MGFIIAAEAAKMTGMEKLALGGNTLLLGLVMVFLILGLLIGVVTLIKIILQAVSKKMEERKNKKTATTSNEVVANTPVAIPANSSNNEEIVAAISAAISMYYETEYASVGKSVKFRVRSIKEIR